VLTPHNMNLCEVSLPTYGYLWSYPRFDLSSGMDVTGVLRESCMVDTLKLGFRKKYPVY